MTVVTAFLRSGQGNGFAYAIQQCRAWIDAKRMLLTINAQRDRDSALNWAFRLEWAAWFPLVLAIISFLLVVAELFIYLPQALRVGGFETYISISLPILIPLQAAVVAGALFVLLRAASEGLFLLLDIQDKPAMK